MPLPIQFNLHFGITINLTRFICTTVALQEHVDDDLQVEETTGEGEEVPGATELVTPPSTATVPLPTVTTTPAPPPSSTAQDSAQIARKIKDIINLKGSSKAVTTVTAAAAEEVVVTESTTAASRTRTESQSSAVSGTIFQSQSLLLLLLHD